jgi:hypothetical protein
MPFWTLDAGCWILQCDRYDGHTRKAQPLVERRLWRHPFSKKGYAKGEMRQRYYRPTLLG